MTEPQKYSFSFTAASLRLFNFMRLARAVEGMPHPISQSEIDEKSILGANTRSSKREMQELVKRYNALTPPQQKLLFDEGSDVRKQLAFVGVCKSNDFVRDFVIEVVREKALVFDLKLEPSDFNIFMNRKIELHPELESFADSTIKKARQRLFKILEEAGLIESVRDMNILPQFLSPKLIHVIADDNPEFLKLFLQSEKDILIARTHDA